MNGWMDGWMDGWITFLEFFSQLTGRDGNHKINFSSSVSDAFPNIS